MRDEQREDESAQGADHIGDLYIRFRELLSFVVCERFRVPPSESENIIHDVFESYLRKRATVVNVRSWLVGAACNACRSYWHLAKRTVPLPEDIDERPDPATLGDRIAVQHDLRVMLAYLSERCRDLLHRRYQEGWTLEEIAGEVSTTVGYVKQLLHGCLKRARQVMRKVTEAQR